MKKKVLTISCAAVVLVLAVLLIPYRQDVLNDGKTIEYTALTYKLVKWNRDGEVTPYTSVRIYPFCKDDTDTLWNRETNTERYADHLKEQRALLIQSGKIVEDPKIENLTEKSWRVEKEDGYHYSALDIHDKSSEYYFSDVKELINTGDSMTVHEFISCATGLPEDYEWEQFTSDIYVLKDDPYYQKFVFVKRGDVFHPFFKIKELSSLEEYENESFTDYIERNYGEGQTDNITDITVHTAYEKSFSAESVPKIIDQLESSTPADTDIYFTQEASFSITIVFENKRILHGYFYPEKNRFEDWEISESATKLILQEIDPQYLRTFGFE